MIYAKRYKYPIRHIRNGGRCRGSVSKTIIKVRLGGLTEPGAGRVAKRKESD